MGQHSQLLQWAPRQTMCLTSVLRRPKENSSYLDAVNKGMDLGGKITQWMDILLNTGTDQYML